MKGISGVRGNQGEKRQLLNIDSLIEDAEKAATTYVDRLQKDPALLTNFKIQYQYAGLMSVFDVEIAEYFVPLLLKTKAGVMKSSRNRVIKPFLNTAEKLHQSFSIMLVLLIYVLFESYSSYISTSQEMSENAITSIYPVIKGFLAYQNTPENVRISAD